MGSPALVAATVLLSFFVLAVRGATADDSCSDPAAVCGSEQQDDKVWKKTQQTLTDFTVAGVNLALYKMGEEENCYAEKQTDEQHVEPPFELFDDFDIGDLITGNEGYVELVRRYKFTRELRSLSFYHDKVAAKRWLPSMGFEIPGLFALKYASELDSTGTLEDDTKAILRLLPNATDYVAKPSHKALSRGVWIVSHDSDSGVTRTTSNVELEPLSEQPDFKREQIAQSLAQDFRLKNPDWYPKVFNIIEPGLVVEQRFTSELKYVDDSALEFKVITIWGRVWVAKWNLGGYRGPWWLGAVHRNGTMVKGSEWESLPDWVDWSRVVGIAESLGAHKDMFRVDIFVGVPAGSSDQTEVQYLVNEIASTGSEPFGDEVLEEGARLWIAGYKMGNYRVVPNTEVPRAFLEKS